MNKEPKQKEIKKPGFTLIMNNTTCHTFVVYHAFSVRVRTRYAHINTYYEYYNIGGCHTSHKKCCLANALKPKGRLDGHLILEYKPTTKTIQ